MVHFSTVECIPTVFGLSFEDMVGVQENTMKREGKSSDSDKTQKNLSLHFILPSVCVQTLRLIVSVIGSTIKKRLKIGWTKKNNSK